MKTSYRRGLVGFAFLTGAGLGWGVEAAKPAGAGEASLEYIVGRADAVNEGDRGAELRLAEAQLASLKKARLQLTQRLRAAEAGTSGVDPAQRQAEIDALHTGLDVCDQQIGLVEARIKLLQNPPPPPAAPVKATALKPLPAPKTLTLSPAVRAIPADKIKSAGATLTKAPVIDVASARKVATGLLASQPGYTSMDVEQLAQVVLMQASQDAEAELRAELDAMKKVNADKKARRDATGKTKEQKDSLSQASEQINTRMQLYQARYDKAQKALSDLRKQSSDTDSTIIGNQK